MSAGGKRSAARPLRGLAALIPTGDFSSPDSERSIIGHRGAREGLEPFGPDGEAVATSSGVKPVVGLELVSLDPADVAVNPRQPRQEFDPDALAELARSLVEVGMLQPVIVRRVSGLDQADSGDHSFELVAGERRLRAARLAGIDRIPAVIRGTADEDLLREALLENLQRVQLNPLEEAAAYDQLLADFGGTHDELAQRLGRSRSQVTNTLRLLRLPPPVQRRVAAGVLSAGHARALLGLAEVDRMDALATRIVAEGMSVRSVEEAVALESTSPKRRTRKPAQTADLPVEYEELAHRLGERLDTRVRIQVHRDRGRIQIEFSGTEDLFRISRLLGDQP